MTIHKSAILLPDNMSSDSVVVVMITELWGAKVIELIEMDGADAYRYVGTGETRGYGCFGRIGRERMSNLKKRLVKAMAKAWAESEGDLLWDGLADVVIEELDLDTWREAYDEALFPPIDVRDIEDPECRKLAQRASAGLARHILDRIMGVESHE